MSQEIQALAGSGNRKLILHALKRWAKECPRDPEPLLLAMKSEDTEILKVVLPLAVQHFPAVFAPHILELLYHPEFLHRRLAVEALQPSLGKDAPGCLYQLLAKESHSHVLASGVLAAARLGLEVLTIADFLKHSDPRVRANAIRAIAACPGEHRTVLEPMLKDPVIRVQNEAIKSLARFVPEKKLDELLVKRLQSPKAEVRSSTAMLIADLPISSRITYLRLLLRDPDPQAASCAARALTKGNEPQGFRALAEFSFSPDQTQSKSQAMITPFVLKLLRSGPPEVLLLEAEKYGQPSNAPPEVVLRLLDVALDNPRWEAFLPWVFAGLARKENPVRVVALEIVQQNASFFSARPEKLVEILESAERGRHAIERAMAARIRLRVGQFQGLETLKAMLRDPDPETRQAAADILRLEGSLLTEKALKEARSAGIAEASFGETALELPSEKPERDTPGTSPKKDLIELPEN